MIHLRTTTLALALMAPGLAAAESLTFAWTPNPQTPQVDVAIAKGYFEEAGLDIAFVDCSDEIQCAGFAGGHPALSDPSQAKRAKAPGVARHHDVSGIDHHQGKRALHLLQCVTETIDIHRRVFIARSTIANEIDSLDKLHRQEMDSVHLFDTVDGDDVGVVHGGGGPGFSPEALEALLVVHRFGRQDLERNPPFEPGVVGEEDLAHGAAADVLEHPVVRQHRADHR